jgi:polyisoprenyl-phosphate glycosyltransferase
MDAMNDAPLLSVVVPVFNEADNLRALYEALIQQLDSLNLPAEIVFINDGSSDASLTVLKRLSAEDERVKVVGLSRNFGHQCCITAGIEHASGDAVIVMDADLQHPPELIPAMIARWREGYHVVYTVREDGADTGFFKRWSSSAFYKFINAVSEVPIIANAADFRLMDRAVVNCLLSMPERSRFLRGMISWVGFRQIGVPYVSAPRHAGKSKYSLRKMLSLAVQGITSFSSAPLRLSTYIGFATAVAVIPYALWGVYAKLFTNQVVHGWASLEVSVLFLGGVQLMSLGIIGEYVSRIYTEVKGRPVYIADELIGFDAARTRPLPRDSAAQEGPSLSKLVPPKRRAS